MSGDLTPDMVEAAFRPPPAWPRTVEPKPRAMPWSIPLGAVGFPKIALDLFDFVRAGGFAPAPPDAWNVGRSSVSIVWDRADAFIVASLADDGSFWLTIGPRFGDPEGSSLKERLLATWRSDHALVTFGAVPVWAQSGEELTGQLQPYRDAVRTAAADLLAERPLAFDRLAVALDAAIDEVRRSRLLAHHRARSARAWAARRWGAFVDGAERLAELGEPVDAGQLATARDRRGASERPSPAIRSEVDRIRRTAADLNAAQRRIHATVSQRERSESAFATWEDSAIAGHRAMERMYPPDFMTAVLVCRTGDPAAVDRVITFLEVDPWCFRSGYMKEEILHQLKGAPLDARQEVRLRRVVLAAVDAGDRREFRGYCRMARRLVDEPLRAELLARLRSANPGVARRALWVLDAIRGPLGPDDQAAAQRILETEADKPFDWWRVARWVAALTRRYGDPTWASRLVERAVAPGPGSDAALRLLLALGAPLSDRDREVLADHLLVVIAQGLDESSLESTAILVDTPALRERLLAAYLNAVDPEVERRARWAINAIRRRGEGGWPEVEPGA